MLRSGKQAFVGSRATSSLNATAGRGEAILQESEFSHTYIQYLS